MKPVDVKSCTYIDFNQENNEQYSNFNLGGSARIPIYKKIFVKGYIPNWSEKVFVIKKVKHNVLWMYVINDLNGDEIVRMLYEKELQWKGYDSSFNSWINKKDII